MKRLRHVKLAIIFSIMLVGILTLQMNVDAATKVKTNKSNFPDKTIRKIVKSYDENKDGYLTVKEMKKIKKIVIGQKEITSFKGIEKLAYLKVFIYKGNLTTRRKVTLDLSKNKKLERVEIGYTMRGYDQQIKTLNLRGCSALKVLRIMGETQEINLTGCTKLEEMNLYSERGLKTLDVSDCKRLKTLYVLKGASLKQVKLGKINGLRSLEISNCKKLEQLNLRNQTNLKQLSLGYLPKLQELNVSKNVKLRSLSLVKVPISKLNLSRHTKLSYFHCAHTKLKQLDLTATKIVEMMKDNEEYFRCYDDVEVIFA